MARGKDYNIYTRVYTALQAGIRAVCFEEMEGIMSKTDRNNVIIVYADDLGFGDLGCYGSHQIPTPNLDRLCENGLRFTNAYATSAVCTPSRYSILTGRYPFRNDRAHILPETRDA